MLKSINNYYLINKDDTMIKCYYELIRYNLKKNSILPNEEIYLLLKNIPFDININLSDKYISNYKKSENLTKIIENGVIVKERYSINLIIKDKLLKFDLKTTNNIFLLIDSLYNNYKKQYKFNSFNIGDIIEVIANIIYYLINQNNKDNNLLIILYELLIIIIEKYEIDIDKYSEEKMKKKYKLYKLFKYYNNWKILKNLLK